MLKNTFVKKIKLGKIFIPVLIVAISCTLLIVSNYLTIRILSASRGYVNGESHYSKAQKDATRHLITYLFFLLKIILNGNHLIKKLAFLRVTKLPE